MTMRTPTEMHKDELRQHQAALKAAKAEKAALEKRQRSEFMPEVEELIAFARERGHAWTEDGAWSSKEAEKPVKQVLVSLLYGSIGAPRDVAFLEREISRLKKEIRETKKHLSFYEN